MIMSEQMVNIVEPLAAIFPQFTRVEIQRCVHQNVGPPELILQTCIDDLVSRPVEPTPDGQNAEPKHQDGRTTVPGDANQASDSSSDSSTESEPREHYLSSTFGDEDSLDWTDTSNSLFSSRSSVTSISVKSDDENRTEPRAYDVDLPRLPPIPAPQHSAQIKPAAGTPIKPREASALSRSSESDSESSSESESESSSDLAVDWTNRKLAVRFKPKRFPNKVDNHRKPGDGKKCANIIPSKSSFKPPVAHIPSAINISSAASRVLTDMPGPPAPKRRKNGRSSTLTRQDVFDLSNVNNPGGIETLPDILVATGAIGNTTAINAAHAYRTKPDGLDNDDTLPAVRLAPLGMPIANGANFNNYRMPSDYRDIYSSPQKDSYTNTWLTSNFAMKRPLEGGAVHGEFVLPPVALDYIVPARLPSQQRVSSAQIDHPVNIENGQHDLIAQNIRIQVEVTGRRNILPELPQFPSPGPLPLPPSVQEIPDKITAPPVVKTPAVEVDPLKAMASEVLMLVPDVDSEYLRTLLQKHTGPMAVNNVCYFLLENGSYPKVKNYPPATCKESPAEKTTSIDYYSDEGFVSVAYSDECVYLLMNEFRSVSAKDIRTILSKNRYRYAPTKKCLNEAFTANGISPTECPGISFRNSTKTCIVEVTKADGVVDKRALTFIKQPRQVRSMVITDPFLRKEVDFVKKKCVEESEKADLEVALQINETEYEDKGQLIECGCCYGSFAFEIMVQCYEGHLFCSECLKQYAQESVFGSGKANLMCMTDGCDATYPMSQLERALPPTIMEQYHDRVKEESLNLADISDLVRCPHCEFAAIMDPNDKVFSCQNEYCKKETCRYCKEDWNGHFGIPCKEMEKKDETKLRLQFEEKMTVAKIRTCHRCKASFTKSDGCNKMTCRCGAKMCYLCREANIDYNHFCQHPRDPGKTCTTCKACSLWTNPEEDDERAVIEIQKKASEARVEKGFTEDKIIGAPPEVKKQRKS